MPPFVYTNAPNPYAASVGELLAHGGDAAARAAETIGAAQARAAEARGQAWGGAAMSVGQAVGAVPGQIQQQKRLTQEDSLRGLQVDQATRTAAAQKVVDALPFYASGQGRDALLASLDGPARDLAMQHYQQADEAKARLDETVAQTRAANLSGDAAKQKIEAGQLDVFGALAAGVKAHGYDPGAFFGAVADAVHKGLLPLDQAGPMVAHGIQNPDWIKQQTDELIARSPEQQALEEKRASEARMEGQAATAAANLAADNRRADAAAAETGRHNLAMEKRPVAGAGAAATALDDVKESVLGMKEGTIPPQLPGRASKEYTATMAEAHRQGYDLVAAVTDWNATQKHIASLNSNAQLKLNQSINALPELLDSVDTLASKWKGGKFPPLNRANLALAKNGIFGQDVATVARQLESQIADVTADLGAVYMGGNSPTDHALELAGKSLSGDWSEKVLHDMVTLARGNVKIRSNSIRNTGVAGASADNPYAPPQSAPPRAGGAGPVGAPTAPKGWKYVPKAGGGWTAVEDK